jgi:hypothetical protein
VCSMSKVSIPDTTWPDPVNNPLWITLERHSSIIKNGTKLQDYASEFLYLGDEPGAVPYLIPQCADLPSLDKQPTPGKPCLAPKSPNQTACVERKTSPQSFVWSCTIKAVNNGGYLRR